MKLIIEIYSLELRFIDCFFRKFTPLIANEIGGIFNKIFKKREYDPCFRLHINTLDDSTFKID